MRFKNTNKSDVDATEKEPKKKVRGRKSFRSISRTGMNVKLLNGSAMHIKKMVKELRFADPNFASESAAVRHYVNIGIAAETATSDLRHSLDNSIVKRSQKEAVRQELLPLDNKVENLINGVKYFTSEVSQLFTEITRRTEIIEAKLDSHSEAIIELLRGVQKTGEESLRNLIVLRSVFYVFLLGYKTGKVEPSKENLVKWTNIITLAHEKANRLSLEEIEMLAADELEATIIRQMASEIFSEINRLPQSEIE